MLSIDRKNTWEVFPINAGEFEPMPAIYKNRGGEANIFYNVPSIIYLVRKKNDFILIDTSFSDVDEIKQKMGLHCLRKHSIDYLLGQYNVRLIDIKTVILTHLHWDHAGSIDLFPNAKFICQKDELDWLSKLYEWDVGYPSWFARSLLNKKDKLMLIEGDYKIDKGLQVWLCGGHSPGSQMVNVKTNNGNCIITGDNIMFYDNMKNNTPVGLFHNLKACINSMERVKKEGNYFIPSHDWKVFGENNREI
jgi:glyoxylase-like metal-dependent hydrolase (beta-lactamase superfamily II)